jgi:hypothetical protein
MCIDATSPVFTTFDRQRTKKSEYFHLADSDGENGTDFGPEITRIAFCLFVGFSDQITSLGMCHLGWLGLFCGGRTPKTFIILAVCI